MVLAHCVPVNWCIPHRFNIEHESEKLLFLLLNRTIHTYLTAQNKNTVKSTVMHAFSRKLINFRSFSHSCSIFFSVPRDRFKLRFVHTSFFLRCFLSNKIVCTHCHCISHYVKLFVFHYACFVITKWESFRVSNFRKVATVNEHNKTYSRKENNIHTQNMRDGGSTSLKSDILIEIIKCLKSHKECLLSSLLWFFNSWENAFFQTYLLPFFHKNVWTKKKTAKQLTKNTPTYLNKESFMANKEKKYSISSSVQLTFKNSHFTLSNSSSCLAGVLLVPFRCKL